MRDPTVRETEVAPLEEEAEAKAMEVENAKGAVGMARATAWEAMAAWATVAGDHQGGTAVGTVTVVGIKDREA